MINKCCFVAIVLVISISLVSCNGIQKNNVVNSKANENIKITDNEVNTKERANTNDTPNVDKAPAPANPLLNNFINVEIFSPKDAGSLGIMIDMEKQEVENILGKPKKIEESHEEAFVGNVLTYYYDFGEIRFEPFGNKHMVSNIQIIKPNYKTLRDIKIGDSVETVLEKFPYDKITKKDENDIKYLYGKDAENSGIVQYDKSGSIIEIIYRYGQGGFGSYTLYMKVMNDKIVYIAISVMNI